MKENNKSFKKNEEISRPSSLDTQILDVFSTLRVGEKMTAENLEIANYFSQVGKKHDPMRDWLRGFNKTFGL